MLLAWTLAAAVVIVRAAQLQIVQGGEWQERADRQHRTTSAVPAPRGTILDRNGTPLAISQPRVKISVAPREVLEPDTTVRLLSDVLQLGETVTRRAVESERPWVVMRGLYTPSVESRLSRLRGVYTERTTRRFLPSGPHGFGIVVHGEA